MSASLTSTQTTDGRVDTAAIRQANPIQDVVARYGIELRRQGRAWVGKCPFHADGGRPNLYVHGDRAAWRCHRCGAGGDVLDFVMQAEQLGFREAAAQLAASHASRARGHAPPPRQRSGPAGRDRDELAILRALRQRLVMVLGSQLTAADAARGYALSAHWTPGRPPAVAIA